VPTLLATVEATVLARVLRAPSIYSARLAAAPDEAVPITEDDDLQSWLRLPGGGNT